MVLGTLTLHVLGMGAGLALARRNVWWSRLAGAGVAALGVALLTQAA
ncbi:hypothetical protein GALL_531830 [mine drainage metagenome]|uniref:HupE / UreJ protein n=1 Tax=mine drainage metagenome TaxID=410659 RepID=A0A1J5PBU3_9ZZZZ